MHVWYWSLSINPPKHLRIIHHGKNIRIINSGEKKNCVGWDLMTTDKSYKEIYSYTHIYTHIFFIYKIYVYKDRNKYENTCLWVNCSMLFLLQYNENKSWLRVVAHSHRATLQTEWKMRTYLHVQSNGEFMNCSTTTPIPRSRKSLCYYSKRNSSFIQNIKRDDISRILKRDDISIHVEKEATMKNINLLRICN